MIEVIKSHLENLPSIKQKHALIIEDKSGRYDNERHVQYHTQGITLFWSKTSIQADLESTIAMAKLWAERHDAKLIYICH